LKNRHLILEKGYLFLKNRHLILKNRHPTEVAKFSQEHAEHDFSQNQTRSGNPTWKFLIVIDQFSATMCPFWEEDDIFLAKDHVFPDFTKNLSCLDLEPVGH